MVLVSALICAGIGTARADNMLPNTSAEIGTLPDAQSWFQEFGQADVIDNALEARTGNRVWKLLAADPGNGISSVGQLPPVAVGERFTISGWVRIPNASPTHQPRVRIRWGFFNSSNGFSSVSGGTEFSLSTSAWTQVTSPEITCPADGVTLVARIYVYNQYRAVDGGPLLADDGTNFPAYVDDLTAESPDYTFSPVSGTVTADAVGVPGVLVKATQTANTSLTVTSAPTDASGNFSVLCRVGKEQALSASSLPPGKMVGTVPAPFTPADTTPITGKDLTLVNDPDYDPDLLFAARSSTYPGSGNWPAFFPSGAVLNPIGAPTSETINSQAWIRNFRATSTAFRLPGPDAGSRWKTAIPVNGVSVVVAVRPIRNNIGDSWNSVVDIFYNRLVLGVRNNNGQVLVWRNGAFFDSGATTIPNGQITVLSLVVQPDGTFKVFANGTEIMNVAATSTMTALEPNWNGTNDGFWQYINVGRNDPDGWPAFNGNIGDVRVYKSAITDTKRTNLEAELTTKYGTATTYTIAASAGAGGSISPSGNVEVPQGADQSFTITPAYGNLLDEIVVDGVSEGPLTSYTFTNVTANRSIVANFIPLPTISGVVTASATSTPIFSAQVSMSTNPDGSAPLEVALTDSLGVYQLAPPDETGTYYLIARKGGYVSSSVLTVVMTGVSAPNKNFALANSTTLDPLVSLDAAALSPGLLTTWLNVGTLGGTFDSFAADRAPEVVADLAGKKAVVFTQNQDAVNRETLVSTVPTPRAIAGASDWTISTVLYRNPGDPGSENCYMSWSGRDIGGWPLAQYRAAQFCYRDNLAAVHYGADFGFDAGTPAAGEWHNVTITYDGGVEKLYVDGVYRQSRSWTLNLKSNTMMMVGGAYWDGNNSPTPFQNRQEDQYWRFNGAIASLQIYDQALTDAEVASLSVDPNDTDGDDMLDTWEIASFGNLDQDATDDFDNDGTDNLTEFRLGLTANSGSSRFALTGAAGGSIQWPSVTGVTFKIERSTTLTGWNVLEASYPGTAVTTSYTDPAPPAGRAFYRVTLNN